MRAIANLVGALILVVMAGGPDARAQTQALKPEDHAAFRMLIQTQLDALRRDDFAAAYTVAAPSMKVLYPTLQAYTQVMRGRYAPLIRPRTVVFGTVTRTSQGPVQRVFITGNDGRAYVANYSLQRQPDDTWLIAGHTVTRDSGSQAL
jgi:hypothetical protein